MLREGPESPPAARLAEPNAVSSLAAANRALGLHIGPATGLTRWEGEHMDYHWAVASLLRRAG